MNKPTPAPIPPQVAYYLACCCYTSTPPQAPPAPEPWLTIMAAVAGADDTHAALEQALAEAGLPPAPVFEAVGRQDPHAPEPPAAPTEPVAADDAWEDPLPFDAAEELPPWPTHAMPTYLASYVAAVATELQVPPDLPGIMVLGVLAVACQKRMCIELDEGWHEPLSLYLCAILPPGERKSPTVARVTAPIEAWEREQAAAVRDQIAAATTKRSILEKSLEAAKSAAAKASTKERDDLMQEAEQLAKELEANPVPHAPRLLADDCTPESLQSLMCKHGGRMGVLSAEPTVWEHMAGKYAKEGHSSLNVYLAGYSGDTLRVDRSSRSEFIERPALTIAVAAQPEVVEGRFLSREFLGRGAVARFLMCVPPSLVGRRHVGNPAPPAHIVDRYEAAVLSLLRLTTGDAPQVLRLAPEAVPEWRAYQERIERDFNPGGELEARFMRSWGCKLAGTVGRIAGLLHLAEYALNPTPWTVPVSLTTMRQAIEIGCYFVPHVRAVYGLAGADPSRELALRIKALLDGREASDVTKRDLWQLMKKSLSRADDLDAPLRLLEKHGYLRRIQAERKAGRPSERFHVHPTLGTYPQNPQNPPGTPPSGGIGGAFLKSEVQA